MAVLYCGLAACLMIVVWATATASAPAPAVATATAVAAAQSMQIDGISRQTSVSQTNTWAHRTQLIYHQHVSARSGYFAGHFMCRSFGILIKLGGNFIFIIIRGWQSNRNRSWFGYPLLSWPVDQLIRSNRIPAYQVAGLGWISSYGILLIFNIFVNFMFC